MLGESVRYNGEFDTKIRNIVYHVYNGIIQISTTRPLYLISSFLIFDFYNFNNIIMTI